MMTILSFIVALGILVLVHEWGHFIVARKSGIRVEQFSIGFGPKLFSITRGGCEYKISLLPLGGFVKLYGEDPVAEAEGDDAKAQAIANSPDAFSAKPLWARLATVFAGPTMNLLLSLLFIPIVFMIGRHIPAVLEEAPLVYGVKANSPAEKAGLKKGDKILLANKEEMHTWGDLLNFIIIHPDDAVTLTYERNNQKNEVILNLVNAPDTKQKMGYAGIEPQYFVGNEPIVGSVSANGPAGKAGIKDKDEIVSLNGKPVETWEALVESIRASDGSALTVVYKRGDVTGETSIVPEYNTDMKAFMVGIGKYQDPNMFIKKRYPFFQAIREGFKEFSKLMGLTFDVLGRLFTFQLSYKSLGGPLQIAQATGEAAKTGFSEFLYFMAFLSMQLGVMNLLPIPVLDGGHVLFMGIEGLRGRPLSLKVRNFFTSMGLVLLLSLMVLITFNDIDRIWSFSNMIAKIKGLF
ncbi:RIP metalloprotease RseP [bacterium]|nr:RIP metalloprotease RseP [bacterium]